MCTAGYLFIGFIVGFIVCDLIFATVILISLFNMINDMRDSFRSDL